MKNINNISGALLRSAMLCLLACSLTISAQDFDQEFDNPPAPKPKKEAAQKVNTVKVRGVVFDEATKQPLVGIQLQMLGNKRYTAMSDEQGRFEIKLPDYATAIYVHSPEYASQQVSVANKEQELRIYMVSDKFSQMYTEGTNITASKKVETTKPSNLVIDQEIATTLAGDVHTIQRNGNVWQGASMFIRGINSINSNSQPLIIVDGIEVDMQLSATDLHTGHFNNMLQNFNPADIESVEVVKNATALYGARGANGVILITTKRGHSMDTRIDANISVGITTIPKLPTMMNASQYRTYVSELMGTISNITNITSTFNFLNDDPTGYYYQTYHNDTDWTQYTYQNALTQNYSINVQGGDDVGMYNLSLGYSNAESNAVGNDWNRMNVRFNTDIFIVNGLTTRFDLSIGRTSSSLFDDGANSDFTTSTVTSPTFLSLIKSPLLNPYQYSSVTGGFTALLSEADELFSQLSALGSDYSSLSLANPVGIIDQASGSNKNSYEDTNFAVLFAPTVTINKDWSITGLFNYSLNRISQRYTRPSKVVPSFTVANLGTVYNKLATFYSSEANYVGSLTADFKHSYGAHNLKAQLGTRYNIFTYESEYPTTEYKSQQDNKSLSHTVSYSSAYYTLAGDNTQWKQIQFYGTADYDYKSKYFAQLTLLGEANSRFGANCAGLGLMGVQWAVFPSIQAGWVMTNEKWFPKNGIDYLKLTAGYDISGNDDINNYAAYTIYQSVKFNNIAIGEVLTNIGNDEIQWEQTSKFNVGLQLNAVHNRLTASFDYFRHKTTNLLTLKTFSTPISGLNTYWSNGGELTNEGFEASLAFKPIVVKDWNVEIGASVGHYKNKVTKLPDGSYTSSIYGEDNIITAVGQPVAMFYGYKTAGVFATDAEAAAAGKDGYLYMVDDTGSKSYFQAGDVHFIDLNDDGVIDENDKTIIGDPNPDIYGNIFASVNWKHLTLSAVFNYSLGNDVYNYQRMILNSGSNFYNQQVAMTNRWRYEGQVTTIPRATYGDPLGNNRFSDRWIEDGSYLKMKSLMLSYQVPINNQWLQGLTIWAEAVNLFTITKYLGSDPEFSISNNVMYQGIDCGNMAQSRAFLFGVKVNL